MRPPLSQCRILLTLMTVLFANIAIAQTSAPLPRAVLPEVSPSNPQRHQPVSEIVLYRHFFGHVAYLQKKSRSLAAAQPTVAHEVASLYQRKIQLTDPDNATLTATASSCEAAIAREDAKAQVVIQNVRAQYPGGHLPTKEALPAVPKELAQMQQERNTIIANHVKALHLALGDAAFQKVDLYVKTQFAPHVTSQTLPAVASRRSVINSQSARPSLPSFNR